MSLKRKLLYLILLILLVLFGIFAGSGCLGYLVRAAQGQLHILCSRRPIPEVIRDGSTPPDTRRKLEYVLQVRKFARDRLGLRLDGSYSYYSQINRRYAAWNVSASRELELKARTWYFPIVGRVPYLGYFSRGEADKKAEELKKEGWDVAVRPVSAYSTLGWFDDPLLSSQLRLSRRYIARILIHEAAHSTIWFPGDVSFNESFASFVEKEGSLEYFRRRPKAVRRSYGEILRAREESAWITLQYRLYARKLDALYRSKITSEEKRRRKRLILRNFKKEFLARARPDSIINFRAYSEKTYNNAHFLSSLRYTGGAKYFKSIFNSCGNLWPCFLKKMKKLREKTPAERKILLRNKAQQKY